jgi:hypothetical protein
VHTLLERGQRQHFRRRHHTLPAPTVDANLEHGAGSSLASFALSPTTLAAYRRVPLICIKDGEMAAGRRELTQVIEPGGRFGLYSWQLLIRDDVGRGS